MQERLAALQVPLAVAARKLRRYAGQTQYLDWQSEYLHLTKVHTRKQRRQSYIAYGSSPPKRAEPKSTHPVKTPQLANYCNTPMPWLCEEPPAGVLIASSINGEIVYCRKVAISKRACESIVEHPMTRNMVLRQIVDENPMQWEIGHHLVEKGLQRVVIDTHPDTRDKPTCASWLLYGRRSQGNKRFGSQSTLYHRRAFQKDEMYHYVGPAISTPVSEIAVAEIKKALSGGRPTRPSTVTFLPAPISARNRKTLPSRIPASTSADSAITSISTLDDPTDLSRPPSLTSLSTMTSDGLVTPSDSPDLSTRMLRFAEFHLTKPPAIVEQNKQKIRAFSFIPSTRRLRSRFSRSRPSNVA